MLAQPLGRFVIEVVDGAVVAERMISSTRRDWVDQQLLDGVRG
jgi:hypothetical protein